ncbi:uncharacterized protein C8A04DRAFT_13474 [Dichotomopilus funicola]|uniref:Mucin n=1 Tax=Dichotomopilus funicola TaxID=1934379 RepID=A0AAN6V240_9PEZI|nr:hypothetical protein C8A04DRAFT_13474 [Dichotomopilus funicola]
MEKSRAFPAASGGTPEGDGAISALATPRVHGGVMGDNRAHDSAVDMPGLIREMGTGVASPSARPLSPAPPLTPRAASSSSHVPFLISSSSIASSRRLSSSPLFLHGTSQNNEPETILYPPSSLDHPDLVVDNATFYLSSGSRSSSTSSLWSTDSDDSDSDSESQTTPIITMPGQTFDALPGHQFPLSNTAKIDNTFQLPPYSADSGRSEQTPSPLSFSRWTKKQHNFDLQNSQQARKLRRRDQSKDSSRRYGLTRAGSVQKRQSGCVPQMTREEFEALPLAIQRKYFSTLERLRFAQDSGLVEGISRHYDDISNFKGRKPRQGRRGSGHLAGRSRGSASEFHLPVSDSSPTCVNHPEATREGGSGRGSTNRPIIRHRASVILDAADEAVYKLNRQPSRRNLPSVVDSPPRSLSPARHSMDSHSRAVLDGPTQRPADVPQSFYDSFRWLDEEEDLDLRLFLDDYHANLREGTPTSKQRPSFRRTMSINKAPFGRRSSISSTRPPTKGATTPSSPIHSPSNSISGDFRTHARRKSRALSLIAPKHAAQPSITGFDPAATHYQDPEARLKLRVYLASPQKFDEAVEFGFPSADALSPAPVVNTDDSDLYGESSRGPASMRTFMTGLDGDDNDDDNVSLYSDRGSSAEIDSPKTPEPFEQRPIVSRHARFASEGGLLGRDTGRKTPEGYFYAQAPASSREMTLRMTLTRPDLRANEEDMYGWQQQQQKPIYQQHARRPTAMAALPSEQRNVPVRYSVQKDSLDRFPEVDHWNDAPVEKGVMRRLWNRVRRV